MYIEVRGVERNTSLHAKNSRKTEFQSSMVCLQPTLRFPFPYVQNGVKNVNQVSSFCLRTMEYKILSYQFFSHFVALISFNVNTNF